MQSRLGYDFPGGKLSEMRGRIPRGIGGILGLIYNESLIVVK